MWFVPPTSTRGKDHLDFIISFPRCEAGREKGGMRLKNYQQTLKNGVRLPPFFFWLYLVVRSILVSRPGIEPVPHAVEAQSPNHWTTREFPQTSLL